MLKRILLFVLICGAGGYGQQLGIYWENDGTFAKSNDPHDKHYTNGARIDLSWQQCDNGISNLAPDLLLRDSDEGNCNFGIFIGQHMQTPDFINHPELRVEPEMRYAGWLYGGPFIQMADDMSMTHLELSLGVIGPSAIAHETQDWIHGFREIDEAVDWDTQLSDRFAGNVNWLYKFRIGPKSYYKQNSEDGKSERPLHFEVIGETAVAAGTVHRNISTGLTVRLGTNLGNDFGPGSINRAKYYTHSSPGGNLMIFGRAAGTVVEHNELLTDLQKETLTGEFQAGIAFSYKRLELAYSQVFMSKQYKHEPESDSFGAFTLALRF